MKKIMLAFAVMSALATGVMAAEEGADKDKGKAKHAELTKEQKEERAARVNKFLEELKTKDEAQYKDLVALKETDPKGYHKKLGELMKQEAAKGKGRGKGKGKAKGEAAAVENK